MFNFISYVFLLLRLCIIIVVYIFSVYSVFILPTGTIRLPWLRFFRAFSSVVRQMPGYNSQRQGTARTLPKLTVSFCVLFVCKCVLYCCHRVSTQVQLTNTSIHLQNTEHHNGPTCYATSQGKMYLKFGDKRWFARSSLAR